MIYELDKSNLSLAIQELKELKLNPELLMHNFYRAKNCNKELGMTKAKYQEIKAFPKGTFKAISHIRTNNEYAKSIWKKTSKKVNLNNPEHEFHEFPHYNTKLVWQRSDATQRKSHNRKHNHPTSMHPDLARTMVNLANTNKIYDPFCGAGGILLEAKLLNKKYSGTDIDPLQVKRANENLESNNVTCSNAFNNHWPKIIVTDLPYGKNSQMQKDFYKLFFEKVKTCKKAIIGLPSNMNTPKTSFETSIYLHKSLSKKIIILVH